VRGAGARQPYHDDRPRDLDVLDLGMSPQQVDEAQAVLESAHEFV